MIRCSLGRVYKKDGFILIQIKFNIKDKILMKEKVESYKDKMYFGYKIVQVFGDCYNLLFGNRTEADEKRIQKAVTEIFEDKRMGLLYSSDDEVWLRHLAHFRISSLEVVPDSLDEFLDML